MSDLNITMLANTARGEVDMMIDGTPYVLRPTFEAAQAIEAATGQALIELTRLADANRLPLDDLAIVVAEGVKAWGRAEGKPSIAGVQAARIGELIYADGLTRAFAPVSLFLISAVTGGYRPNADAQSDDEDDDDTGEPVAAAGRPAKNPAAA